MALHGRFAGLAWAAAGGAGRGYPPPRSSGSSGRGPQGLGVGWRCTVGSRAWHGRPPGEPGGGTRPAAHLVRVPHHERRPPWDSHVGWRCTVGSRAWHGGPPGEPGGGTRPPAHLVRGPHHERGLRRGQARGVSREGREYVWASSSTFPSAATVPTTLGTPTTWRRGPPLIAGANSQGTRRLDDRFTWCSARSFLLGRKPSAQSDR